MIIVKLIGGLGNQMFQYAAGRRAAIKNNTILKLDIMCFAEEGSVKREYSLGVFNVLEEFASRSEIDNLKTTNPLIYYFPRLSSHIGVTYKKTHIREKSFSRRFLNVPANVYLDGHWHSEKYFIDIEGVIRKEFTLKNSLSIQSQKLASTIKRTNSVSLHIRRRDYISVAKNFSKFYQQKLNFYFKAISLINRRQKNLHIFLFSDDIPWCKKNLRFSIPIVYVSANNDKRDYEDLYLMSLCRHNVIANSSFSWWSAWLNKNPEKIIVAPLNWYHLDADKVDDLVPNSWIKI